MEAGKSVEKEDLQPREQWANKCEFILSCIGFSVGLGNVWRFPYLCYTNGGGAFFIPYFLCLLTGGVPLFFMEVGIGQFMGQGGISAWDICPVFKGIGYGTTLVCFYLNVYYIIILAWALFYLFASFTSELPWASCDNPWNSVNCSTFDSDNSSSLHKIDAVDEYWNNRVLGVSAGIEEVGGLRWELFGTLGLAWLLCYFCIWKGVKTTGKVVYFTATFPYVMLTIILIRGITLPGAIDGIKYFLSPDFSRLLDSQVWIDAGTQIFFSYAIAIGCMVALGSYNKFNNNFVKDCAFISFCNSGTSIYAGFVIFSILGFMANQQNVHISQVADKGPGLAFIAYPKAVAQMPWAPFWSVMFFLMILVLGLDSQFVGVEGCVTAIMDIFPNFFRRGKYKREIFVFCVSFVSYLIGTLLVTNGGIYYFKIFDYYSASGLVLLWFCFFECVAISWVYGVDRFYDNIESMIGYRLIPWLKICWKYSAPAVTIFIFMFSVFYYVPLRIDTKHRTYIYPFWGQMLGWFMALSSMIIIPGYMVYSLLQYPGTLRQRWAKATEPNWHEHQLQNFMEMSKTQEKF